MEGKKIESAVEGNVHGNDISAGFDLDWVQIMDLNTHIAAANTQKKLEEAIRALNKNRLEVFKGPYTGVNRFDPDDTIDLTNGYHENEHSSHPTFSYILKDVITEENFTE